MDQIINKIRNKPQQVVAVLILYFAVGLGLFMIPATRILFSRLTPLSLIMSFAAVLVFQITWNWKLSLAFILVFLSAILVELIGVQTGLLFGSYQYGDVLGPKVYDTPFIIGLNWLILIYCTSAIMNKLTGRKWISILMGSGLMVVYDLVLEYVAPVMDMWSWETRYPGFRNFGMWFLVSVAFHSLFQLLGLNIENKPARFLFLIQLLFFCGISIYTFLTS
jgi:uncharacterized membrane protein